MAKKEHKSWKEERRKRAWELYQAGWPQKQIAEALGVTKGAVSQWIKAGKEGGEAALNSKKSRFSSPVEHGRTAAHSRAIRTWGRELRFSRQSMDLSTGGEGDRAGVGREVPPCPREPHSERTGLDTPKAHSTSQTAQGS